MLINPVIVFHQGHVNIVWVCAWSFSIVYGSETRVKRECNAQALSSMSITVQDCAVQKSLQFYCLSSCQHVSVCRCFHHTFKCWKFLEEIIQKKKKKIEWLDIFWVPIIIDLQHSTLPHSCQIFAIENIFCFDLVMLQVIFSNKLIHTNQDKTNNC